MPNNVFITLDTGVGSPVRMDDRKLRRVGQILRDSVIKELQDVTNRILQTLREQYRVHDRERIRGPMLSENLKKALVSAVIVNRTDQFGSGDVALAAFDLDRIRELTADVDPAGVSWWEFFEPDRKRSGDGHGSSAYGFVWLDQAVGLAYECGQQLGLGPKYTEALAAYVKENFKGKHGEGIMVELGRPLFGKYPEFGNASKHVDPHPGFEAWNILAEISHSKRMNPLLEEAFERAKRSAAVQISRL